MFTAYVANKAGKITLCPMPSKRAQAEEAAAKMSKEPNIERVSLAAYGRIVAAFRGGVQIDVESSQHGADGKI